VYVLVDLTEFALVEYSKVTVDERLFVRLKDGEELRAGIEQAVSEAGAHGGWFIGFGGLRSAELWYFDQQERQYDSITFDQPLELTACIGNIASVDNSIFAHTHVTVADMAGNSFGGHLEAAEVFVGELYIDLFEEPTRRESSATPVLRTHEWLRSEIDARPETHSETGFTLNHTDT
jgi:predicted DNA-binding protein with PD1-like motif